MTQFQLDEINKVMKGTMAPAPGFYRMTIEQAMKRLTLRLLTDQAMRAIIMCSGNCTARFYKH